MEKCGFCGERFDVAYGMQTKHALTCYICGAELPYDIEFQQYHMAHVHKLEC